MKSSFATQAAMLTSLICLLAVALIFRGESEDSPFVPHSEVLDRLESLPDDPPVVLMRLLKYQDGRKPQSALTSLKRHLSKIKPFGGEVVFWGDAKSIPRETITTTDLEGWRPNPWDALVIERYDSRQVIRPLMEQMEQPAALERTMLYALNRSAPSLNGSEPKVRDIKFAPAPPSADAVYMLNLLKFKPGGKMRFFRDYVKIVTPIIREKYHGDIVYGLKPEQLLIGAEEYDRVIQVRYPSVAVFQEMVLSEDYQKISHHRVESIEIGHLFAFTSQADLLKSLLQDE